MNKSEQINELATALAQFQSTVKQPLKDKENPFFRSKYVPLENVAESVTESAGPLGLSYMQFAINKDNEVGVATLVMHKSGQYIEFDPIFAKPAKNDPQGVGSAITYLKRYSLSAAFGITSEDDDDGNSNINNTQNNQKPKSNFKNASIKIDLDNEIKTKEQAEDLVLSATFKKHAGKKLGDVFKTDKEYINMLVTHQATPAFIVDAIVILQNEKLGGY